MTTMTHEEFKPTITRTDEKLFNMFTILKDEYDNKYTLISYEEESYMDEEQIQSLHGVSDRAYDYIVKGGSYGTLYDLGYNV